MELTTESYVIIGSVIFFYARYLWVRWRRGKKYQETLKKINRKKGKNKSIIEQKKLIELEKSKKIINNWFFTLIGIILIILGIIFNQNIIPNILLNTYWWSIISLGIIIFSFGF